MHPSHHKKPEQVHHNNSKNNVGNKTTDDTNMTENANADEISSITDDSYEYNVSNGNNGAIVLSNDYENFGVGDGDGTFNTTMKQDISPATINSRFFGGLMLAAASAITAFATAMFGLVSINQTVHLNVFYISIDFLILPFFPLFHLFIT